MRTLVLLGIVGLAAQLVDGSLGMAYGVTSTTLLLAVGANPAAASATVHLAEIGTTLASGASHWRFGNVDWKVVLKIGIPGAIGAFAGATVLSRLSTEVAAPVMSIILLSLGLYLLIRFALRGLDRKNLGKPLRKRFLTPLGLVGGFLDATGGGGWGPVGTPALLASGRIEPRKVIGSIDTSEFLVALAASIGFLVGIGSAGIDFAWVAVLLLGGLIAAPIAAWLVRRVPPRVLGSAVGGVIVLTNTRSLLRSDWIAAPAGVAVAVCIAVLVVWIAAVAYSVRRHLDERDLGGPVLDEVRPRPGDDLGSGEPGVDRAEHLAVEPA
ncbi:sulfite exporter TauE/SafE family protein [Glycomyces sp. TRM65418]|uniref:sulfite exporter TauE/SafE family protein n=1 Tax=Glycomyces sp. TRM65418 TaxID=2867006 RepID=UPI001CE6B5EB|nr:sulfite exporter TauE/SafE family protein [Glycomyces sp. TRM65418]MCC3763121.1 sulfite exporter TauE/SafE family protein [Glycomyces sp. TRM65418]QZD57129.1 sulfite exporter TauE/SafE family protein [Glycomyces sp. TRM65418]